MERLCTIFTQKGIARQIVFLVLYYTGIIGIMSILKPFMVDLGYSMKEIGFLCGIIGIGAAFVMAYPAGILVRRYGYQRMRSVFAFINVPGNTHFCIPIYKPNFTTTLP